MVVLCTKGKNKGVGVGRKGVGERDPEKEERERERKRGKRGKKIRVGKFKEERQRDRESSHDFLFFKRRREGKWFWGGVRCWGAGGRGGGRGRKGRRAGEERGVVKKLLKEWDSGIMTVAKAKPKVKSKFAPVRTYHVVQILSSLQPMRAGNNSAADLSLHHVSVVHVR